MSNKRIVRQVTANTDKDASCGLACIAMVTGCSHSKVKKLALTKGYGKDGTFHTDAGDLRKPAACLGVTLAERKRKFKGWKKIPHKSIVAINYREKTDSWHWVVPVRENNHPHVLDPNQRIKSERRIDFRRMGKNSRWYLPVVSG